jgi:histidinol-phosphatase
MRAELALALALADEADAVALARFRARDLRVDTKPDLTPVTEADRAVEDALRARLAEERPDDGFLGEETGESAAAGGARWIVDPIDGTRNYSRGIPVWATLIALAQDGEVELGVVSAPALHRRWWAVRGSGAYADGDPIHVSGVRRFEDAVVSFNDASLRLPGVPALAERSWHARAFGDFWAHMLVAEGAVDVCLDPVVSIWDLAAVSVVVEEAGGAFTDLRGERRIDGGSGVSTNGHLHQAVLRALATRP